MTPKQMDHVLALCEIFENRAVIKYAKGAKEHGGNIWDLSSIVLVDNAIEECIDQFMYLMTLRKKLEQEK